MNTSQRYCTLVLVILFGALGGCAAYQKCGFGGCPGDKELTAAVESAFKDHADLDHLSAHRRDETPVRGAAAG